MKEKEMSTMEYIRTMMYKTSSDAIEAIVITSVVIVLSWMAGVCTANFSIAIRSVLKMGATVMQASFLIRHAKLLDRLLLKVTLIVVAIIFVLSSVLVTIIRLS